MIVYCSYNEANEQEGSKMDKYTEFGYSWEVGQHGTVFGELTVVAEECDGGVELTEQDLRDMLAEIEAQKG